VSLRVLQRALACNSVVAIHWTAAGATILEQPRKPTLGSTKDSPTPTAEACWNRCNYLMLNVRALENGACLAIMKKPSDAPEGCLSSNLSSMPLDIACERYAEAFSAPALFLARSTIATHAM